LLVIFGLAIGVVALCRREPMRTVGEAVTTGDGRSG